MNRFKLAGILIVAAIVLVASTSGASAYTYTRDLTIGSTGADVTALQTFLVSRNFLVMPTGVSMGYFGTLTKAALSKYQASAGISPAAGYFGPITRAKLNSMSAVVPPGNNDDDDDDDDDDSDSDDLQGGDGDFKNWKVKGAPNAANINEGTTDEVLAFEFEAKDSDLRIERIRFIFSTSTGTSHPKPWKVLEELTLYRDGDEVDSIDASDQDVWDEEQDKEYSIDFSDLEEVIEEGDESEFTLEVTAKNNFDTGDVGKMYVWIDNNGIRAMNAEGIDVYKGDRNALTDAQYEKYFNLKAAGTDLSISVDSEENEDKSVEVDDDSETEDVVLYSATLEPRDGDINIDEITFTIAGTGTAASILSSVYLYIDGDQVGSESGSASVEFEDLDFDVEEDDEIEIVVKADIADADQFTAGDNLYVSAMAVSFANAADDDTTTTETTDGGTVTFDTKALSVSLVGETSVVDVTAGDETKAEFRIRFKVSAPDEYDIYINDTASTTGGGTNNGVEWSFYSGTVSTKTAERLVKISGGSETGGLFRVSKGNDATFEMQIVLDNKGGTADQDVRIELDSLNYATNTDGTSTSTHTSGLDEDFRTPARILDTVDSNN